MADAEIAVLSARRRMITTLWSSSAVRARVLGDHLIDPLVTPEMTHRCEKMYTIRSGAIAMR